jgi:hypothetical protein
MSALDRLDSEAFTAFRQHVIHSALVPWGLHHRWLRPRAAARPALEGAPA